MAVIRLTRPLGILFATFCALAATAAADPIDERARPALPEMEGASAPATEGTGAAGIPEAAHASDQSAKPRGGNPLWAVPLNALSATRDRPLFSASRRPPIVPVPMAAAPPKQEAVAPPPPPERPLVTLIGTIVSPRASLAMLQGSSSEAISRLRIGEENDGWRVRGIDLRSIVVEKGEQSVKLDLPRPDGSPPKE
jgi:general secretion pathway protein N